MCCRADPLVASVLNQKRFVELLQTTFSFDLPTHHDVNIYARIMHGYNEVRCMGQAPASDSAVVS